MYVFWLYVHVCTIVNSVGVVNTHNYTSQGLFVSMVSIRNLYAQFSVYYFLGVEDQLNRYNCMQVLHNRFARDVQ